MNLPRQVRVRPGIGLAVAIVCLLCLATAALAYRHTHIPLAEGVLPEVERSKLVLREKRLELDGKAFTGWMLELYPDGLLKSRSAISNGVLHGVSEGWFTNRTMQVSEHFVNGVSHGERRLWDEAGRPVSAAQIEHGRIVGVFQRWHANGQLSEEITMKDGQPEGLSRAWYPSGRLKSEATMSHGTVKSQRRYEDVAGASEGRDSAGTSAAGGEP